MGNAMSCLLLTSNHCGGSCLAQNCQAASRFANAAIALVLSASSALLSDTLLPAIDRACLTFSCQSNYPALVLLAH